MMVGWRESLNGRGRMPQIDCPHCNYGLDVPEADVFFGKRIACPRCETQLEVINERPLRVEQTHRGRGGWITDWLSRSSTQKEKENL